MLWEANSVRKNTKGVTMLIHKITGCATAAAVAAFLSIGASQAAMSPVVPNGASNVQRVDCAVGFHLGPVGTCIVGVDNPPPPPPDRVVIEHHDTVDQGCETKTINRTDSAGNSETKTKTNCP